MRLWLKIAREKAAMTHEQVAEKAIISRSYYTNIESGTKTPSVKAAKSIAMVLGVPWENFLTINVPLKNILVRRSGKWNINYLKRGQSMKQMILRR